MFGSFRKSFHAWTFCLKGEFYAGREEQQDRGGLPLHDERPLPRGEPRRARVGASALGLIGPVIGAIMHEVAAVPVIANAARLISRKPKNL